MLQKDYQQLIYQIIGSAMEVHRILGWGLLEPIYQEALYLELQQKNISCSREQEISITYKQFSLEKKYKADIVVNNDIIVELKSVAQLLSEHRAQLCNYLRLTKKPYGPLINFGERNLTGERWQYDIETNECTLIDKDMKPIISESYKYKRHCLYIDEYDSEN